MPMSDNDSDPPPPPSGADPRRRSYGDLRNLHGLEAIIDRQNEMLRQERLASKERADMRREDAREQRQMIGALTAGFSKLEVALNTDVSDMRRAEKRLDDVEKSLKTLVESETKREGALATIKWLMVVLPVATSALTWVFSHIKL